MGFFDLSDGTDARENEETSFSAETKLAPIPDNTTVKAACDQAEWKTSERDGTYISLRWTVLGPEEYSNRKVFQKIQVLHSEPEKRDKAIRMLRTIDLLGGGKLAKMNKEPTDEQLILALTNVIAMLKLRVWEIEDDDGEITASGNWVAAVSEKSTPVTSKPAAKPTAKKASSPKKAASMFDDDTSEQEEKTFAQFDDDVGF